MPYVRFLCKEFMHFRFYSIVGRRGGLMISAPVPGSSGPGLSPGRGHCCVLRQDTLLSQCVSPPRSINGYQRIVGET